MEGDMLRSKKGPEWDMVDRVTFLPLQRAVSGGRRGQGTRIYARVVTSRIQKHN